jgi:hypothetical protein
MRELNRELKCLYRVLQEVCFDGFDEEKIKGNSKGLVILAGGLELLEEHGLFVPTKKNGCLIKGYFEDWEARHERQDI